MAVFFQATEVEDWLSLIGSFYNSAGAGSYNPAYNRGGLTFGLGAEFSSSALSHPFSSNEFWTSLSYYCNTVPSATHKFLMLNGGGTRRIAFSQSAASSGVLRAFKWNGASWDIIATGSANSYTGVRQKFDIYVKLGNPGVLRVYKDSLPVIAATPDFSFGGLANLDTLEVANANSAGGGVSYFNEVIVAPWNTIGSKLVHRIPDANGNHVAWTGAGFGSLDELDSALDFMTSNVAGQRASYLLTDFPALVASEVIDNIRVNTLASRDGGGPQNMNHFIRSGGVDYDQIDKTLTMNQTGVFTDIPLSPATGAAWTIAGLNAAEFGMRSRT